MEEMEEAEGAWIRSTRKAPPPFQHGSQKEKGCKADRLSIHQPWLICEESQICGWDIG